MHSPKNTEWSLDAAREQYSIAHWGEGYFLVDDKGQLCMRPRAAGPALALTEIVATARKRGLRLPLLVRSSDILADRLARLQGAFARSMQDLDYAGGYTAIYPIKVNQQRGVAGELVQAGERGFGLEAGSKPELMAVLALARPGSVVICNGYKDREYVRLALTGRKLGLATYIVIEKPSELRSVIEEARALGVDPLLGVRVRLATIGAGKWQNTGGDKAKFGLNPRQVLDLIAQLTEAGLRDRLQLLHFHMGSQISNVRDIANGMREATRYVVELKRAGVELKYVDVGGGLGVDYEGTRSRSECSINYSIEQYASTIVQPLAEACREHKLKPPHILTEAGRAMTAHHAVLVVNVSEVERAPRGDDTSQPTASDPPVLRHLRTVLSELGTRPALELYHEAQHFLSEGHALFALGQLDLSARARLDDLFYAIANAVRDRLKPDERAQRAAYDELNQMLVDKYFMNFSVFESIPDVWAIDQVFPIVPLSRLHERPDRRAVLADLTCDSDGRIDQYVDADGVDVSLPLHSLRTGEPYWLGIFMIGAYQETLGDIHNLFGDTDAVNVRLTAEGGGYEFSYIKRGDTTDALLDYVGYDLGVLRQAYRTKVAAAGLDDASAAACYAVLETGLTGYTYLKDDRESDV
jgi:arginine decarboxylase